MFKRHAIRLYSIKLLDFVNFLTFDESYNVKLVFYSVKLVFMALFLAVGLGHTHRTPPGDKLHHQNEMPPTISLQNYASGASYWPD
jgi:hypothetical protein